MESLCILNAPTDVNCRVQFELKFPEKNWFNIATKVKYVPFLDYIGVKSNAFVYRPVHDWKKVIESCRLELLQAM